MSRTDSNSPVRGRSASSPFPQTFAKEVTTTADVHQVQLPAATRSRGTPLALTDAASATASIAPVGAGNALCEAATIVPADVLRMFQDGARRDSSRTVTLACHQHDVVFSPWVRRIEVIPHDEQGYNYEVTLSPDFRHVVDVKAPNLPGSIGQRLDALVSAAVFRTPEHRLQGGNMSAIAAPTVERDNAGWITVKEWSDKEGSREFFRSTAVPPQAVALLMDKPGFDARKTLPAIIAEQFGTAADAATFLRTSGAPYVVSARNEMGGLDQLRAPGRGAFASLRT